MGILRSGKNTGRHFLLSHSQLPSPSLLLSPSQENVGIILEAGAFFQIEPLRNACCKYLTKLLEQGNCIGVYRLAEKFQCTQLQEAAYR